jgi:hypothetical protein
MMRRMNAFRWFNLAREVGYTQKIKRRSYDLRFILGVALLERRPIDHAASCNGKLSYREA